MANFDPAKDVIDLSAINSNPGGVPGASSNFTFIGTSAFTAAGDEVRYEYVASANMTYIEANLAGDDNYGGQPDFFMRLSGNIPLTAANFALPPPSRRRTWPPARPCLFLRACIRATRTNSSTRMSPAGPMRRTVHPICKRCRRRRSQSEFDLRRDRPLFRTTRRSPAARGGELRHRNRRVQSRLPRQRDHPGGNGSAETFAFSSGFGNETINGFSGSDTLKLSISAFSYLNRQMTQAQDLAALLGHVSSGSGGATITDSAGDKLTLAGVTASALASTAAGVSDT